MDKLLPCPFCGGEAAVRDIKESSANGWVGCQRCRCFMDFVNNGKPQAVSAWNRRADDERLKTALKEIVQLACESVEREKTLARLEAEVMTAIDAAPVVRGEWVKKSSEEAETLALCSKCSYPISWWHKTNYCPNCGAKMGDGV